MKTNFTIRTNKRKRQITITVNSSKYTTYSLNKEEFETLQEFTYFDWMNYIKKSGNVVAL